MKTFTPNHKLAIREMIRLATGADPGCVHPEYLLTPAGGGIHTVRIEQASRQTCHLAVHFLPVQLGASTRWISFNLN